MKTDNNLRKPADFSVLNEKPYTHESVWLYRMICEKI